MSPLEALRARLGTPRGAAYTAVIVSVAGDSVVVESGAGRRSVLKPAGLVLGVGDAVLVAEGNVLGRVKREADVSVYRV